MAGDTAEKENRPELDHLALAGRWAWDNVIRYCSHLGARWIGGADPGQGTDFYFAQAEFAHGTKLEFLQPLPGTGSEFLRRFLLRNGPGPHHFTFKVPDIHAAIGRAERAGYQVVNARFDNPDWQEVFLHPKQSHGIVIQVAQPGSGEGWATPPLLPPSQQHEPPAIRLVTHLVADLQACAEMFTGLLGLSIVDEGTSKNGRFVTLTQGPWRLELIEPVDGTLRHWMGNRPGRMYAITVAVSAPELVPDVQRDCSGGLVIPPDHNQGTRLRIVPLNN